MTWTLPLLPRHISSVPPVRRLTTLLDGGSFFEGPRWHDGCWWVSDIYRGLVLAVDSDGRAEAVMTVPEPSGLGWLADGSLLVVSMADRRLLRRDPSGEVSLHADLSELVRWPLNDMVVDAHGRAYVGNFGFDLRGGGDPATAALIRVDPEGSATVVADELMYPNGSVITPDGGTLIVGESTAGRYTAFTIEADGSLSDRRVWAQVGEPPELGPVAEMLSQLEFNPDGCGLDAEGHIWAADAKYGRCVRLAPGGEIVEQIPGPGMGVFACMLGGEDGRTLLMCAAPGFGAHERTGQTDAQLATTTVDVPRAGLP
jgi:sugar lactone lactonase YvrE